ncbi:glycoside hydrolase family 16 protein [Neotamlana laminarinivorans]|uniref:Glycoside hydrolase family 16 protein n=1 Tax=Neotamlana laminarinivorans TaxID=2883124 RepID=A0A9X1HY41_9FLAO|nr:glycoside hydrolase family 16 protein [Tamlana laminarinivorans]MCB4798278.1 glycoside hydrolase family 16 protein [Tamlana laminarinivorans]
MKPSLVIVLFLSIFSCKGQDTELLWEENFDGNTLNESVWNFELGYGCPNLCGWGNNELQEYTKTNHKVANGLLTITAKHEDSVYSSTRITTKNKFQFKYGKIEARAKLPVGKGLWPAFWMLGSNIDKVGWPKCGEIDILEYVGKEPHKIFNSLHTQNSHGNTINTKKTKIDKIEEGFHIYTANWTETKIEFFVDNELLYTFATDELENDNIWPFNQSFYVILNLAIGGNFGGPEVDDSIFPQEFVIDYIKVYKHKN